MFEKLWSVIDSISIYVEIIFFLVTTVGGFLAGFFFKKRKGRKIRKILGFRDSSLCEILVPTWKGNIEYTEKEARTYAKERGKKVAEYDYVYKEEAESLLHIQSILSSAGFKSRTVVRSPWLPDLDDSNDKFLCGGPLSNIYLKRIFSTKETGAFSFKRSFLFGCGPYWTSRKGNELFADIQKALPNEVTGHVLFVEKEPGSGEFDAITANEGYMILIRHISKNRGTHFICFGNSAVTSSKAVKCITEDTDIIYNIVKKHKNSFFLIIKCSVDGNTDFDEKNVIDLTDAMFN